MWLSNIQFAFTSLASNKMRSFLTMLGIMIGVFAVTVLMSIGEGVRQEVSRQIEGLGSNVLVVIPGKVDTSGHGFGGGGILGASTLTNHDLTELRSRVPEIEDIDAIVFLAGTATYANRQASDAITMGVGPAVDSLLGRETVAGRWITQADLDQLSRVVVLDWLPAQALFSGINPDEIVGQKITFLRQQFEVVGVDKQTSDAKSMFSGFNPLDNRICIPLTTAQSLGQTDRLNRIIVRVQSSVKIDAATAQIKDELLKLHAGAEDFTVLTQEEILKTFNSVFGILTNAVAGIAAISLLVGGIGIMNIMLVAVAERTKEIGIRKAVGATDGNILAQFLVESITLGFLGGLVGLVLSFGAALLIELRLGIPAQVTFQSIALALGISIGAGVIFGVVPALRAARKNPVEALRYE